MSMPVGQSRAQPLQDRHRSSASSTAGSSKSRTPVATSWSTRARPRVESFSSRVATYDGHITPPERGVVGDALADAGAAVHGPGERPGVVGQPQRRTHGALWRGEPEVGVERRRVDQHTRVEQVVGVEDPLGLLHQRDRLRRSTSAAAARSAPGRRRARRTSSRRTTPPGRRRSPRTRGYLPRPRGVLELEVDPHVHAAVAEVAVGNAVQRALLEERVEVAQVGAELGGRHGGVLPAGLRGSAQRTGRQAGAVLADPPQRQLLRDVGDDPVRYAGGAGDLGGEGLAPPPRSQR